MILESNIVGSRYHDGAVATLRILTPGDTLELKRDRENKFSSVAIGVWWCSQFLGFVRDTDAERVAPVIDSHHHVTAQYKGNSRIDLHLPFDV